MTRRPYYRTKAEWAEATAKQLESDLASLRADRVPSANWRRVRSKMAAIDNLSAQARRYRGMAERFRAAGQ